MRKIAIALTLMMSNSIWAVGKWHEIARHQIGGDGGWDCLVNDDDAHRLYIARSNRVLIVDSASGAKVTEIPGLEGAHGVALVKELNRGFASSGKTNELIAFDLATFKIIERIKVGENPDIVIFDDSSKKILSFNGKSHDMSVVDPATNKVVKTVALPGKPEFAVADGKGQIFINLEDKSQTIAVSASSMSVTKTIDLAPCEEPTGLAIDRADQILIVGCGNKLVATVGIKEGKVLQTFPAGDNIDGAAFDSNRKTAFIPSGDGMLTILTKSKSGFTASQSLSTVKGARILAVDEKAGHVFLPMAKYEPIKPGEKRPQITPGTFSILVVGQEK